MMNRRLSLFFLALTAQYFSTTVVEGFSSALFQEQATQQVRAPAIQPGVEIELPDFDELFYRIQQTSPLARVALNGGELNGKRGLQALENNPGESVVVLLLLLLSIIIYCLRPWVVSLRTVSSEHNYIINESHPTVPTHTAPQ